MMLLLLLPAFFAFYSGSGPNLVSICLTLCLYSARVCSNIVLAKNYFTSALCWMLHSFGLLLQCTQQATTGGNTLEPIWCLFVNNCWVNIDGIQNIDKIHLNGKRIWCLKFTGESLANVRESLFWRMKWVRTSFQLEHNCISCSDQILKSLNLSTIVGKTICHASCIPSCICPPPLSCFVPAQCATNLLLD